MLLQGIQQFNSVITTGFDEGVNIQTIPGETWLRKPPSRNRLKKSSVQDLSQPVPLELGTLKDTNIYISSNNIRYALRKHSAIYIYTVTVKCLAR